ncbi:hypothetical protein AALP_AAs38906U000100, partial [Arabis alpina]
FVREFVVVEDLLIQTLRKVNVSEIFHQNYYIPLQLVVEKMLAS